MRMAIEGIHLPGHLCLLKLTSDRVRPKIPVASTSMIKSLLPAGIAFVALITSCTHEPALAPQPDVPTPTKELVLQKITSGDQNVQAYSYSAQGLLSSFQSHWVYDDSASTASTMRAEFNYDAQNRLSQITTNGSLYVKFFYEGKLFDRTEEYDHRNRLIVTHFYLFNAEGQLVELLDQIHDPYSDSTDLSSFVKFRYEYDNQKNVQRIFSFTRKAGDTSFKPWQSVHYEGYDDKKNPYNSLPHYPFVAQSCTQVNNPGKIITKRSDDQSVLSVLTMTYTYNAQGYPTRKTQQLTTTNPLAARVLDYHYE